MCALNLRYIQFKLKCHPHTAACEYVFLSFHFSICICALSLLHSMEWAIESFVNWRSLNGAIKCSRDSYYVKMQLTMNAVKCQSMKRCTQLNWCVGDIHRIRIHLRTKRAKRSEERRKKWNVNEDGNKWHKRVNRIFAACK